MLARAMSGVVLNRRIQVVDEERTRDLDEPRQAIRGYLDCVVWEYELRGEEGGYGMVH